MRLLRVGPLMRRSRLLLFPSARGTNSARSPELVRERLGCEVVAEAAFEDLIAAAETAAVVEEARRRTEGAQEVAGPTADDVPRAARISVALQELMQRERARGLTVGTCMG